MIDAFTVSVPGSAATLTASRAVAEPWKRSVAAAARAARKSSEFLREPCAVELAFHVTPARQKDTAVYNLLKATIDGVASAVFAPSPSGPRGEWSRDDWWITELRACKLTAVNPFVEIAVAPAQEVPADAIGPSVLDVVVPGSPPVWPGDAAGQRRVLEWARLLGGVIHAGVEAPSPLGLDLTFTVEASRFRSSDLDNYCVPAAQHVCAALYGGSQPGCAVVEITARKIVADATHDVGTRVRVLAVPEG